MRHNLALVLSALSAVTAIFKAQGHGPGSRIQPCTPANTKVRKEWGDLPKAERKAYTNAVRCMQKKKTRLDPVLYNTTSVYDDFVAVHINYTRTVHNDGIFLPWHRGFVHAYENELEACGYKGGQPYWDWIKWGQNLAASPIFDGSEFSMGGNGADLSDVELATVPPCRVGNISCPLGQGGGCVTEGPFKDYKIRYLPASPLEMRNPDPAIPKTAFHVQERCFSRMLNQFIGSHWQVQPTLDFLMEQPNVEKFQAAFDEAFDETKPGLHPFGHWVLGPTGADIFSSPADPAFFLHHSQVDKIWSQWQAKDQIARSFGKDAVWGTVTGFNIPPSDNATLATILTWGGLIPPRPLGAMQARGAPGLCYKYE
ncbi:tyrosinase central domain protein [Auriculariales sp. MPI-PUGE-AT-0066]|nr:tyrosinase central domain protein [Auriculariales sp. MPI-PUGE-AT-0066]